MRERLRFDRITAMERLKKLLESAEPQALRYACLEARLCIEALVYAKLRLYMKRIPEEVLGRWQPRAAMRALLELEPRADQDFVLRIIREDEAGNPTGKQTVMSHRALNLKTINRYYDRFGSYLHVPTVEKQQDLDWIYKWQGRLEKSLREFVEEVEPIVKAPVATTLSQTVEFDCASCDKWTVVNIIAATETGSAKCIHCSAEYVAIPLDAKEGGRFSEKWEFELKATVFSCLECDGGAAVENRKLEVGLEFRCEACGARHVLAERHWGYGVPGSESGS